MQSILDNIIMDKQLIKSKLLISLATLARLDIPVLFIYGKKHSRIPLEMGLSQAMVPKRSKVLLLENVAHMSFMEDHDYVKTRLSHFVKQCYRCEK